MRKVLIAAVVAGCGDPERPGRRPEPTDPDPTDTTWLFEAERALEPVSSPTQVANVRLAPLDGGPGLELVVAEASPPALTRVTCAGACMEEPLPLPDGLVPARTSTTDLDADGDADLVVAVIGSLGPTNAAVGSLWVLRREGPDLVPEEIVADLGRLVCAEPGDIDGDGDTDLVLCAFGHRRIGMVGWYEQTGGAWERHVIHDGPGTIHAFPVDVDDDGDLDVLAGRAQLTEQLLLYRNDGAGGFSTEVLFRFPETWYGLSGIEPTDLDQDGDVDVLLTNGDTMDGDLPPEVDPSQVHAIRWFENDGTGRFTEHLIARLWGAYTVRAADMEGDGDLDVVLGCFQRTRDLEVWTQPAELHLFENDGAQNFVDHVIPGAPEQLITLELGDADQDGDLDVFAGSLQVEGAQSAERLVVLRQATPK